MTAAETAAIIGVAGTGVGLILPLHTPGDYNVIYDVAEFKIGDDYRYIITAEYWMTRDEHDNDVSKSEPDYVDTFYGGDYLYSLFSQ